MSRVMDLLLERRIRECLNNGTLRDPSTIAAYLKTKFGDYTRFKPAVFNNMISEKLELIESLSGDEQPPSQPSTSNRKRKRSQKTHNKNCKDEVVTVSDSDQDIKSFPDTNYGNTAITNLYNHNKTAPPALAVTPTIFSKSQPATQIHQQHPQQTDRENTPETSKVIVETKKKTAKKTVADPQTYRCEVPSLKRQDMGGASKQFLDVFHLMMHMKRPEIHQKLRVQPPVGVLIHGPPGCGKTRFAHSVAGELNLPLIHVPCTELISGVSGESENKIRNLFQQAKENSPCIVLLDEVDVISSKRDTAQREMEKRIVTQLIACLDDLVRQEPSTSLPPNFQDLIDINRNGDLSIRTPNKPHGPVLVLGTSSRLETIDMALRRAGRFDKEISLGIPDEKARIQILKVVCKDMVLHPNVSLQQIARLTPGYVGSDLCALSREASTSAVNRVFETIVPGQNKDKLSEEETEQEIRNILGWLNSDVRIHEDKLNSMSVEFQDFVRALGTITPSSIREGFATVPDVSWEDVGALKQVRSELEWSILNPIKRPEAFESLGITNKPQGILLCGPPGCGKTLLAKAIANETGLNFISVKGPELLSMYVGESERAVRTVFQRARDSAPCVIFFDEIDALCPKRSNNETSGSARLVNQMLTEMDGVEARKQVFLIGATNRPDIVDPAILRPGRLDKVLFVDFPDANDRADILRKSTKNGTEPKMDKALDFTQVASLEALHDYTGADLTALVHEAGLLALREKIINDDVNAITFSHFETASNRLTPSVSKADRVKYEKLKEKYSLDKSAS